MTTGAHPCYVVVSPVRDEAEHLERVVASVVAQTVRPLQWVLVDDGSTDGTGEIVDRAARGHAWITAVHRANRGRRLNGTGAFEAFRDGYRALGDRDWVFLAKLDGDLVLPPDYFERCLEEFARDPRLGIGGGTVYHLVGDREVIEPSPRHHVRGATKIYRRACWEAIGGLAPAPGWDTLDEVRAWMAGWTTRSFPGIRALHLRPTGSAEGPWANAVKDGQADYMTGYHPLFMLLKCVRRLGQRPYGAVAAGLLWGFASGYLRRVPRPAEPAAVRFVRREQLRRLLGQPSLWS